MRAVRAVALYSGGLDSTLAILTLLRQGIEVKAVTFLNHFGCEISDRSSCSKNPFSAAARFGFEVKLCHLSEKFIAIVKNPKFGHGKNMNPCVDCRILMLREAREFMEMTGARFIVTGEVLGQRPMSQRRDALDIIDREAGLRGLVLRPLSALLLRPTLAEEEGLVDRALLHGFGGRSRKPQMALAAELGLTDYPAPAGGCLLTEPNFSHRLRELLDHDPDPSVADLQLLRVGRHFRFSEHCRIIVGRDMAENEALERLSDPADFMVRIMDVGSPITLIRGAAGDDAVALAAALCALYSDARHSPQATAKVTRGGSEFTLCVSPADRSLSERLRIEKPAKRGPVAART